jgi:L-lactate dehydrogenase complex protein LldG
MNGARERVLAGIRSSLHRGPLSEDAATQLRARLAAHRRNLIPARAMALDERGRVELFVAMAEEVQATVSRLASHQDIPDAIARYLAAENLPAALVVAPDRRMDCIPWERRPLLRVRRGRAEPEDAVALTPCYAAIAETGTLMLISGPDTPTTLNFLPDTHIVVVRADQVVAVYEDGYDRLRAGGASDTLPRVINFITGPSRTADIEQHIELGAHGPRRLHIVLVEGSRVAGSGDKNQKG